MIRRAQRAGWRVAPVPGEAVVEPALPASGAMAGRRASARGLAVPFLTTSASTDLALWWLLLPLWWAMGVEQIAAVLLLFTAARTMRGHTPAFVKLLLLFIVVYALSGFFIVESFRYATFARGLMAYVGAFAIGCTAFVACRVEGRANRVVGALIAAMAVSAAAGLAGAYDLWRPEFVSLIAELMPGAWTQTGYGSAIASRSVGQEAWFLGLPYYRAKGTFLFATMLATAMAAVVPLAVYGLMRATTWTARAASGLAALLLTGALIASTGRMAGLGLCIGAAVSIVGLIVRRKWTRTALCIGAMVFSFAALQYIGPSRLLGLADQFVYARGDGSVTSRTEVYRATLAGIAERPLLGWGTERDVDGLPYPAGSHSYYLGLTYKHGLIGVCVMALLFWRIWRDSTPTGAETPAMRTLLVCARWAFLALAVNALTDAPDLDAVALQAAWTIVGLALGATAVDPSTGSRGSRRLPRPLA